VVGDSLKDADERDAVLRSITKPLNDALEVATSVAAELQADKLLFLNRNSGHPHRPARPGQRRQPD